MKRISLLAAVPALAAAAVLASGAASSAATNSLPTVTISDSGSSLVVAGQLESGAVNVTTTTTNKKGASPALFLLKPGVTADQALAGLAKSGSDPNGVSPYGSIVFDYSTLAGSSTVQTVLPAGNYVAVDAGGTDPAKFPHTAFTVATNPAPAALPAAAATVHAIDFGFKSPKRLHTGATVRFVNDGYVVHMIDAVKVKSTKDARKVTHYLLAGKDNKAGKLATGDASFLGPVSTGGVLQGTLNAKPGIYVLVCFMPTQDGREHTRLGMEKTIRIVK